MFILGQGEGEVAAILSLSATAKDFKPQLLTAPGTNSMKISQSGVPG
jgi:hypothetical protein